MHEVFVMLYIWKQSNAIRVAGRKQLLAIRIFTRKLHATEAKDRALPANVVLVEYWAKEHICGRT
jgi:hypothetical protein